MISNLLLLKLSPVPCYFFLSLSLALAGWSDLLGISIGRAVAQSQPIVLKDVSAYSGLDFTHNDGSTGRQYLIELMPAGLATLDFDNDGRSDAYMLNGCELLPRMLRPETAVAAGLPNGKPANGLFRNNSDVDTFQMGTTTTGAIQFTRCERPARIADRGYGLSVVTGDFNNDGFCDVYVGNFGHNRLYQNNGDGTFTDMTLDAGVADGLKFSAGAVMLDVDNDGDLDLFSGNYVDFQFERHAELAPGAYPFPPGPKDFQAVPDTLFRNEGNGQFSDWSQESGIARVAGPSMGAVSADFDADGDLDIFVCCDGAPNHLFRNDGLGKFEEDALAMGVAFDVLGRANGSMGAEVAELNGDGVMDLLVTDYAGQLPMLFLSDGVAGFADAARRARIGREVLPHVNWGAGLVDLDCDGDKDAYICNGHFLKKAHEIDSKTKFAVENTLQVNTSNGRFANQSPADDGPVASSRGAAFEDFDLDGDIDVCILNCNAPATLLENRTASSAELSCLQIELIGTKSNRSAVGATVAVQTTHADGIHRQLSTVHAGRGYQSDYGRKLHFGLGSATQVEAIEIAWPSGMTQVLRSVPVNQHLLIIESADEVRL